MREYWKRQDKKIIWCLLLIAGAASVPLLTDYVLQGSDLAVTLSRIRAFSRGIGRVFPVRIGTLGTMDHGYSGAAFQADICYLIPSILYLAGAGLGAAYKWMLFFCNLLTTGLAYGCFKRCGGRREIGLLGSMLSVWNPYRLNEMYLVGDLGEIAAWSFLPLILLGLWLLYAQDSRATNHGKPWVILTWGFSLIALMSTVILFVAVGFSLIFFLLSGRESLRGKVLRELGKAGTAVLLVNVWFLIPMLLRLRDARAVGAMLWPDVRSRGMFLAQYLTCFFSGGDETAVWDNGLRNLQAMGPGIAVILCLFFYLWTRYTGWLASNDAAEKGSDAAEEGQSLEPRRNRSMTMADRLFGCSLVMAVLSTNFIPWDLLQNKNLLFSILLALMNTPAKLGIGAGTGLIAAACFFFLLLSEKLESRTYRKLLSAVAVISFGTMQFFLGRILFTRPFVRQDGIKELSGLDLPLVLQESLVWRISEAVSAAAVCGCALLWIIRRHRSVKESRVLGK